jgi:hypothetical protein
MVAVAVGGAKQQTRLELAQRELQIKVIEAAIQFQAHLIAELAEAEREQQEPTKLQV